jgi:hypothetical protein
VTGRVTVEPQTFTLVEFDAAAIAELLEGLLDAVGIDAPVHLEVDQTTPLGHAEVASLDPIVLKVESGALEDPRRLRQLSPAGAANVLGRLLFRTRDRLDPTFGDPPSDQELPIELHAAWDAYAVGRLVRMGHANFDERQRRLYQFRTRHGFSDAADVAFAALWDGEGLTWADVERHSAEARAAQAGQAATPVP